MASIKAQIELDVTDEQFEQAVENVLKNNPDYVLVVRCKDCKYSKLDDVIYSKTIDGETNDTTKYCCFYRWDHNDWNDGEHFCSYGERREGE